MRKLAIVISIAAFALPVISMAQTSGQGPTQAAATKAAVQAKLATIVQKLQALSQKITQLGNESADTQEQAEAPLENAISSIQSSVTQVASAIHKSENGEEVDANDLPSDSDDPNIHGVDEALAELERLAAGNNVGAGVQNAIDRHMCISFSRTLSPGSSGDDVSSLQTWLASRPSIYPEGLVTGNFGPLTQKAVQRFQGENGIEQTGNVGPKTNQAMHDTSCSGMATSTPPVSTGGGGGSGTSTTSHAPITRQVTIANMAFAPVSVSIKVGDTVKWTNQDATPHTVSADDNSFGSNSIAQGGTFSHTFTAAGTVHYHCSFHPTMTATVVVSQ